jgi:hypothetical protein
MFLKQTGQQKSRFRTPEAAFLRYKEQKIAQLIAFYQMLKKAPPEWNLL